MWKCLKKITELVCAVLYSPLILLSRKSRQTVIFYHNVSKMDIDSFSRQMAYLAGKCQVVKVSAIREISLDKGQGPKVAITFDDAFVGVLENAVPILIRYDLPAAICVPTGNLERRPDWDLVGERLGYEERVMSANELVTLFALGFELFSHTVTHPRLALICDEKMRFELIQSKLALEKITKQEVVGISYPHGSTSTRVCQAARDAGYRLGFGIEPISVESSPDDLRIGRCEVFPSECMFSFRLKVFGAYQAIYYLRSAKQVILQYLHKGHKSR
jgi:peptidoglycan/xylan/chitin deacetylase (PgdA/CDA1 family)